MSDENRSLSVGWFKAEIVAKICASLVIPIAVVIISYFFSDALKEKERINSNTNREKEIQTRYIEIAVQILQQEPKDSNTGIRIWAIEIFKKYSPILISDRVEKELLRQPLYKSVIASSEFSAKAGFETNASVISGNKNPQNKNLSEKKASAGITFDATVVPTKKNSQSKNLPEQKKR